MAKKEIKKQDVSQDVINDEGFVTLVWTGKNKSFSPGHEFQCETEKAKVFIKKGLAKLK